LNPQDYQKVPLSHLPHLLPLPQDYQKGVDLIQNSYDWLMGQDVQLVFLGSGSPELEQALRDMENRCEHFIMYDWTGFFDLWVCLFFSLG